jgi:uncharacterized protein (TIGR03066 family)
LKWLLASLVALCAAAATYALFYFVVWSKIPSQMAGAWLVRGGELDGAILEFSRNGAMVGKVNMQGKEGAIKGKVAVEGDKLHITTINPLTRQEHTDTQTIRSLTDHEFIIVDRNGTVISMERLE